MPQAEFRFKQFIVKQDQCAMKVGTDGVLLGAWVKPSGEKFILDIGTGTGLIALMMAQKSDAVIHAIDIDESAYVQARENFQTSPWPERLVAMHQSLQRLTASPLTRYELIVSNPPYFIDASPAPSEARNIARHMDEKLSIHELVDGVKKLLTPGGRFCVIFPSKEGLIFRDYASVKGLYANRITKVRTKADKSEKRFMMEFSLTEKEVQEEELVIHEEDSYFTKEYIDLTSEYYLGLTKR
jgi:tRNA1Val (adenine37-N6)-methyltransferase